MKKLLYLIALNSYACSMVSAQQFLNGSFEQTTAITCEWNISNSTFNSHMSSCFAYGARNELDIQKNGCHYGVPTAQGKFFVSLHSALPVSETDAFSLFTDVPLIAGTTYGISFYVSADTTSDNLDSLLVGISADSSQFGTLLYTVQPPVGSWNYVSFNFTAPVTTRYITFQNQLVDEGWNFIESVTITPASGITENEGELLFNIFPNPVEEILNVNCKQPSKTNAMLVIYDAIGTKVLQQHLTFGVSTLNLQSLAQGIYFIEIRNDKAVYRKMFLKD